VKGDLRGIARARRLSEATMRNIRQNLFFAFVYNALGVPIAAGVLYPFFGLLLSPIIASAAMTFSSVSVIANALRLAARQIMNTVIGRTTMELRGMLVICLTLSLFVAGAAVAQQPSHEHNPTSPQQPASAPKSAPPAQSDQAHQMQHMQDMEMCRQMMTSQPGMMGGGMGPGMIREGMMAPGMMGMMPMMISGDPKQHAEMMAMRGEMMKAMGDIMLKYAQRMQSTK
jgi:hypothetical protein